MVAEKRSAQKLDFMKELDSKFASFNPDSLPTLNTYLEDMKEGEPDGKIGLVTPNTPSGIKEEIHQREAHNWAQKLHYGSSNFQQDSTPRQTT